MKRALRSTLGKVGRRMPGLQPAVESLRVTKQVQRIAASGIFDAEWYALLAGTDFDDDDAALRHYVETGRRQGLSPNPFFEPEWYDRKRWRGAGADPLHRYLGRKDDMRRVPPSAAFEPNAWTLEHPQARQVPPGPLAHMLARGPQTQVPLEPIGTGSVTAGQAQVRAHLVDAARRWRAQELVRLAPRRTAHFDREAEAALLARFEGKTPPLPDDGSPLVSVVMPVLNRERLVRRAVESVQAQTLSSWELVVVDDGSTDDTFAVLTGLAAFEPRIRLLQQQRSGVSAARNTAIAAARGRMLAFLDSDNTWEPDFLRLMCNVLEDEQAVAGYSAMELHSGERVTYRAFGGGREHLLVGNHVDLNVLVARTDVVREVGAFDTGLRRAVDFDLVLRLSARAPLHYAPFIGAVYTEDAGDADRISVREPITWDYVVRARHGLDWEAGRQRPRVPGRISVVVEVKDAARLARRCVGSLLADLDDEDDVEIVVLDNASRRSQSFTLAVTELVDPRIRVLRMPVDVKHAFGVDAALLETTGETVVVCAAAAVVPPGWSTRVREGLADADVRVVQAVVTGPDSTVVGAGVAFTGRSGQPVPLFRGHPVEDVRAAGPRVAVPGLLGDFWAARAADLLALEGLDIRFAERWQETDLSLRAVADGGRCVVLTDLEVMLLAAEEAMPLGVASGSDDDLFRQRWGRRRDLADSDAWASAGLQVVHHRLERTEAGGRLLTPVVVRPSRTVEDGPAAGLPALRWALKIAAPAGPKGRTWGDWHFAQSLARSLRRLGQDVVVDVRAAHYRPSGYLDDVNLVLRGLDVVDVDESRLNLMWVISHPEQVTAAETASYDRVFAASTAWSERASATFGAPVEPLLQCTDAALFRPEAAEPDSGAPVLFVGNSRALYRDSVRFAIEAGADVHVYGGGWEPFVDEAYVRGTHIDNADLPAHYAAAGVVLNDHWSDMRLQGFVSNRVFDVLACAGRLATDDVAGLESVLPGAARVWRSSTDLAGILADVRGAFPDRQARLETSRLVREQHSFDARARRLLDVALELR